MLFSGKKYVFKLFGCLKIHFTENQFRCLVRSNIFTENALHSQATQFSIHLLSVNMLIMNQFHTHSQKKQNPAKKENQIQSNWDSVVEEKVRSEARSEQRWDRVVRSSGGEIGGEIEVARSSSEIERRGTAIDDRCNRQTGARSVVIGKVSSSSLFAIWALSLSLSFGLLRRLVL